VVRHPLVAAIVSAYDNDAKNNTVTLQSRG